jgi:SARP family transcriptional regulator, regulator of embCAB operon
MLTLPNAHEGGDMPQPEIISADRPTGETGDVQLSLLGHFSLRADGVERSLAAGSCRLIALLALRGRRIRRSLAAGTLWPEADDARASACLRSAIARLGRAHVEVLCVNVNELSLDEAVRVDLRNAEVDARRLLAGHGALCDADRYGTSAEKLSLDLLPGWYDEWVLMEAESWRQLRLHALEALSIRLSSAACYAEAILAGLAAVSSDPLRESARYALIRAYLAEGNRSEAQREFGRYRELLLGSLGIEPTPRLHALAWAKR